MTVIHLKARTTIPLADIKHVQVLAQDFCSEVLDVLEGTKADDVMLTPLFHVLLAMEDFNDAVGVNSKLSSDYRR